MRPELMIDRCMRCGACAGVCPVNAIFLKEHSPVIGDECTGCGLCIKTCPAGAFSEGVK